MTFESKRDRWLAIVIGVTIVISVGAMIPVWMQPDVFAIFPSILTIGAVAMLSSIWFGTRYRIDGDTLDIRCGLFHWQVPLHAIESVEPTDDPSSAPALSLDRISIKWRKGQELDEILVSPLDKEGFIAALKRSAIAR